MDRDKKLNSILRRHLIWLYNDGVGRKYIPYWASSLCDSTQYGIYFLPASPHYKAVLNVVSKSNLVYGIEECIS